VFASANAIPSMAVNTTKQSVTTNVSSNYSGAVSKATTFANGTVIAGIALRKSISGDSIAVDTKVKFFSDITAGSDYRLAVYMLWKINYLLPNLLALERMQIMSTVILLELVMLLHTMV
jgi:hypothetical protein